MSESIVVAPLDAGVVSLTSAAAETRNPLSRHVRRSLIDTLAEVGRDSDVRPVILRTAGHVFSSGHALKEIRGADPDDQQELFASCSELMQLIQRIPQP